ncbi:MAG: hypothetical protein KME04_08360 [Pleurocapsa minor GSE-CHR-MK-17-07R]|nr:hypothetical protein [Pleurocapsa minor GSE-CHR-MK 17-07R]
MSANGNSTFEAARELRKRIEDVGHDTVKGLYGLAENIRKEAREAGVEEGILKAADEAASQVERIASTMKAQFARPEAPPAPAADPSPASSTGASAAPAQTSWTLVIAAFVIGVVIGMMLRRK